MSKKNLIEIGSFVGAHGIKGEVKLKSFTEIPENIFSFKEVFIESSENPIKLKLIRKLKQIFVFEAFRPLESSHRNGRVNMHRMG